MWSKSSGVDLDDLGNAPVEGFVPFVFGRKPHVEPPRLELMAGEDAANRLRGDGLDDAVLF